MERCVETELLDELPADDLRAVRSREDLLRINAWMGNGGIMVRALKSACNAPAAPHIRTASGSGSDREPARLAAAPAPPGRPGSPNTPACSAALRAGPAPRPGGLAPPGP